MEEVRNSSGNEQKHMKPFTGLVLPAHIPLTKASFWAKPYKWDGEVYSTHNEQDMIEIKGKYEQMVPSIPLHMGIVGMFK